MKKKLAFLSKLILITVMLFMTTVLFAQIEPTNDPENTSSYTLEDLYNRLNAGNAGSQSTFTEPLSGPSSTMHLINDIMGKAPTLHGSGADASKVLSGYYFWGLLPGTWAQTEGTMTNNGAGSTITPTTSNQTIDAGYWSSANTVSGDTDLVAGNIKDDIVIFGVTGTYEGETGYPAPVPKTGQTTPYATGDDGDLEKGVAWPSPRFTDNSNGTVTDNLTGLIWLKSANCFGSRIWATALGDCNSLENGCCGLSDGSSAGDWRLPNMKELLSLIDFSQFSPPLPSGYPFTDVQSNYYWSSTTDASATNDALHVLLYNGSVSSANKFSTYYVWPVRGGE